MGSPFNESKKTIKEDGFYQRFEHGSIYWNSKTGAFEVHGGIEGRYTKIGHEASFLGYPLSDTIDLGEGCCFSDFEGGAIYFNPLFGAYVLRGSPLAKWRQSGAEKGVMGYPVSDTETLEDGIGQYQHFQSGDIYYHPDIGAFEVRGRVRIKWLGLGGINGKLGYPVSDTKENEDGSYQKFQHGSIIWHKTRKQMEVKEQ